MVFDLNNFCRLATSEREKQITVDICGLVNGPFKIRTYQTGSTRHRIPVILPDQTQCLLELWTPKGCPLPKLEKNWKQSLQMIIVSDLLKAGNIIVGGKIVKVLRLPMFNAKNNRLIWLSAKDFWAFPTEIENDKSKVKFSASLGWPDSIPIQSGFLRSSEGCIITKNWKNIYPKIHSSTIEPFGFETVCQLHTKVNKSVAGYVNLYTKKAKSADFSFER